jgi:lambda family phage portal protein
MARSSWLSKANALIDERRVIAAKSAIEETPPHRQEFYSQRIYQAGVLDRLSQDQVFIDSRGADRDIWYAILTTKARARDLRQNDPIIKSFQRLMVNNVVGPFGPMYESKVMKPRQLNKAGTKWEDPEEDEIVNEIKNEMWEDWTSRRFCTAAGDMTFLDVCKLMWEQIPCEGESFIRTTRTKEKYGMWLQLPESDDIDVRLNYRTQQGTFLRMGVEMNQDRKRLAYYLMDIDPSMDMYFTYLASGTISSHTRVPADGMIHFYVRERPSQTRGITWYAPVAVRIKHLNGYEEAGLINARVAASKMVYYKRKANDAEPYTGPKDSSGNFINAVEPGLAEQLPYGWEIDTFNPEFPTNQYEPYTKTNTREISMGLGPSYPALAHNLTEVNFSSIRSGENHDHDMYQDMQERFTGGFLDVVAERLLESAILSGALGKYAKYFPLSDFDRLNQQVFTYREWPSTNPVDDAKANVLNAQAFFKSSSDIVGSRGDKYRKLLEQIAKEKKWRDQLGLVSVLDAIKIAAQLVPGESEAAKEAGQGEQAGQSGQEEPGRTLIEDFMQGDNHGGNHAH